jgi:hypothetical protein
MGQIVVAAIKNKDIFIANADKVATVANRMLPDY